MDRNAYEASCEAWEDAGLGEAEWQTALDLTETLFESSGVILHAIDKVDAAHTELLLQSRLVPREGNDLYAQYAPYDLRRRYGLRAASGEVVVDEAIAPVRELDRTMVYADLYHQFDFGRCAAVRLDGVRKPGKTSSRVVILNVLRQNRAETASDDYRGCVLGIARTVQRALRTATALGALRTANTALAKGLDLAPFGVVFVRGSGIVVEANTTARKHFDARTAIGCSFGTMVVLDINSRAIFQQALGRVCRGSRYEALAIQRGDQRPLGVAILPSPTASAATGGIDAPLHADAVVLIFDPESEPANPADLWRAMFGLTEAEIEVAQHLVKGLSPREISLRRQVSFETVRSQCKRIYAKLGVDGQSAAALMLSRNSVSRLGE